MSLKEIGEFGFIRRIARGCVFRPDGVVRGIGDDAAVFGIPEGEKAVVTADLLVERVHFLRSSMTGADLGHKSLAVNLSDIAAMGATARHAFVSIAVPKDCPLSYLDDFYEGMRTLARKFGVNILGGDTTGSERDLVVSITMVGSGPSEKLLYRDGAKAGDAVVVTGPLGESRAGLHLILNDIAMDTDWKNRLFHAHVRPEPHLEEGRFLAEVGGVHAMIDVSDGLSSDIGHVAADSGRGVLVRAADVPVSQDLVQFCTALGFDAARFALAGGEDYVLAAAMEKNRVADVCREFSARFGRPLYMVGEITEGGGNRLMLADSEITALAAEGWDHFSSADTV